MEGRGEDEDEEGRGSEKEIFFLMNMAVLCLEIPPIFSVLLVELQQARK
jgi:hypothetical protein